MDIEKVRPMDDGKPPPELPRPSLSEADGPGFPPPYRTSGAAPIIATATMGAADQRFFDALRTAHFPPERNHLAAHITLFPQLPPSDRKSAVSAKSVSLRVDLGGGRIFKKKTE